MRKIFINEANANRCNGYALASNYAIDEKDSAYISVKDMIDILQNEANVIAGELMSKEMNPSPDAEIDRRYAIGKWDKLNELIYTLKNE